MIARRKFLIGLGSVIAAPAVVRAASLMPVKALPPALTRAGAEAEFLEAMSQQMAYTIFYGNSDLDPCQFTGLIPFYPKEKAA